MAGIYNEPIMARYIAMGARSCCPARTRRSNGLQGRTHRVSAEAFAALEQISTNHIVIARSAFNEEWGPIEHSAAEIASLALAMTRGRG